MCGAIRTFVTTVDAPLTDLDPEALTIRRLPTEQSNTPIVYDSRVILKCFRRVESGMNPDVEISRHLTDVVPFAHIPPLIGEMEYEDSGAEPTTLAMLQRYIRSAGSGWQYTLDFLERYYEEALERVDEVRAVALSVASLLAAVHEAIPELRLPRLRPTS